LNYIEIHNKKQEKSLRSGGVLDLEKMQKIFSEGFVVSVIATQEAIEGNKLEVQ
jgi:hypothetical protein